MTPRRMTVDAMTVHGTSDLRKLSKLLQKEIDSHSLRDGYFHSGEYLIEDYLKSGRVSYSDLFTLLVSDFPYRAELITLLARTCDQASLNWKKLVVLFGLGCPCVAVRDAAAGAISTFNEKALVELLEPSEEPVEYLRSYMEMLVRDKDSMDL